MLLHVEDVQLNCNSSSQRKTLENQMRSLCGALVHAAEGLMQLRVHLCGILSSILILCLPPPLHKEPF